MPDNVGELDKSGTFRTHGTGQGLLVDDEERLIDEKYRSTDTGVRNLNPTVTESQNQVSFQGRTSEHWAHTLWTG